MFFLKNAQTGALCICSHVAEWMNQVSIKKDEFLDYYWYLILIPFKFKYRFICNDVYLDKF